MANLLIYFPHATEAFENVTDIKIENGVLTFYWKVQEDSAAKKMTTNAVFRLEEQNIGVDFRSALLPKPRGSAETSTGPEAGKRQKQ